MAASGLESGVEDADEEYRDTLDDDALDPSPDLQGGSLLQSLRLLLPDSFLGPTSVCCSDDTLLLNSGGGATGCSLSI